jgi:glycosyltransferase involved in cell wall biosynthesis
VKSPVKLLMLCWAFPPDAQVGAIRAAQFCRYLPEFGVEPIVLTMEDRFRVSVDNGLTSIPGIRIERTEVDSTQRDWYRRLKGIAGTSGNPTGKPLDAPSLEKRKSFLQRQILALLQFPEPESGWYRPALRKARQLVREGGIAGIFSTSPPTVSHRVAVRMKQEFNLPWLADFRDPWTVSLHVEDEPVWWRRASRLTEARCLREADRVICNTEWMRREFLRCHPELPQEKFVTLTNGFENTGAPAVKQTEVGSRRIFLHLGNIYGRRGIDTFCEAIDNLVAAQRIDPATFQIIFLGDIEPSLEAAARRVAPALFRLKCVDFRPRVERSLAHQALWQAEILLLFQGSHRLQIPAKFYEYLPTGRPIFAVAQRGALTDVLEETGAGIWAAPESTDEIKAAFLRALVLPRCSPDEAQRRCERFHYRLLTKRLAGWYVDLVESKRDSKRFTNSLPRSQFSTTRHNYHPAEKT